MNTRYIKTLLITILFTLPVVAMAQTHDLKARNCRNYKAPPKTPGAAQGYDGRSCSTCAEDKAKETALRAAEDKRRADAKHQAYLAEKAAQEARRQEELAKPTAKPAASRPTEGTQLAGGVIAIDLQGRKYTVTKNIPADISKDILGKYMCDTRNGSPIVELGDGEGLFQRHGVPPDHIEFWIDCDEQGNIRKQTGPTGNYGVTLLFKYTSGDRLGDYDLMGVTVAKDGFGTPISNRPEITGGYAVIYGERYKPL